MKWKQTQTTLFQCFRKSASEAAAASAAADDTKSLECFNWQGLKKHKNYKVSWGSISGPIGAVTDQSTVPSVFHTALWTSDSHYLTWSWSNMLAFLGSIKEKYAIICKFNWLKTKVNEGSWKISYPVAPSSGLQLSSRDGIFAQQCNSMGNLWFLIIFYTKTVRSLDEFGACGIKAL